MIAGGAARTQALGMIAEGRHWLGRPKMIGGGGAGGQALGMTAEGPGRLGRLKTIGGGATRSQALGMTTEGPRRLGRPKMIGGGAAGVQALGMTKPASIKRGFLRHLLHKTEEEGDAQLGFAAKDKVLGDPDWKQVRDLSSLDHAAVLKRYMSKFNVSVRRSSHFLPGEGPEDSCLFRIGPLCGTSPFQVLDETPLAELSVQDQTHLPLLSV
jgi:hypothetical protein